MPDQSVYPPVLKAVLRHALRFCALIEAQGGSGPPIGLAQAWLVGRPREIQAVMALLIADWQKGRYDAAGAAAAGRAYLDELHQAFLGLCVSQGDFTCCHPDPDRSLATAAADDAQSSPTDPPRFDPDAILQAVRPIPPLFPTSSPGTAPAVRPAASASAPASPLARAK